MEWLCDRLLATQKKELSEHSTIIYMDVLSRSMFSSSIKIILLTQDDETIGIVDTRIGKKPSNIMEKKRAKTQKTKATTSVICVHKVY